MAREVCALGKILSQETIGVFIAASLPRALRIAEVDFHICRHRELRMLRHLQSAIPSQRSLERCGEFADVPAQSPCHGFSFPVRNLYERDEPGLPLDQRHDLTALGATQ